MKEKKRVLYDSDWSLISPRIARSDKEPVVVAAGEEAVTLISAPPPLCPKFVGVASD